MTADVLAIDGGNSKTDVLLVSADGRVSAHARGPGASPQLVGVARSLEVFGQLVREVAAELGHQGEGPYARHLSAYLAGVDLPREQDELSRVLATQGWAQETTVGNDTFALLRAGTPHGHGVAVVCGAGINCVGVAADGSVARLPALGRASGDWGGGSHLADEALWWAVRAEDGRGAETALRPAIAAHFGVPTLSELVEALHFREIPRARLHELSPLLLRVAASGDPVARAIVDRLAEEVVLLATLMMRRLALLAGEVEIILGGGVLTSRDPYLIDRIEEGCLGAAPRAVFRIVDVPPVVGAALLGLDALGADRDAERRLRARYRADVPPVDTRHVPAHPQGLGPGHGGGSPYVGRAAQRAELPGRLRPRADSALMLASNDGHYRAWLHDGPRDLAGTDVFDGSLASPLAVLRESKVQANITAMQAWCTEHGVQLAPHGKTTMAPGLFARQLAAGAWGMTVANPAQARIALAAGAERVLIANEVTDAAGIRWLGETVAARPDVRLWCYVDSVAGVALLEDSLSTVVPTGARLDVLLELGVPDGRTGVRTHEAALVVARAVAATTRLRLAGVSGYEGVVGGTGTPEQLTAVDDFCRHLRTLAGQLHAAGLVEASPDRPLLLSAGGSAFFDDVAAVLTRDEGELAGVPTVVVLRSGSYVTHDHGLYARVTPTARGGDGPRLEAAFEVWGRVLSRPEPTRVLVDVGRRDAPYDQDLPHPMWARSASGGPARPLAACVRALNDQHAFLDLDAAAKLAVGEWVGFGVSHPCTAADKWNVLLLVDDEDRVVRELTTCF